MQLTLIRHTKVDVPEGTCYGQTNVGLAESYADELIAINKLLKGEKFHCIYSSPLKRCVRLAHDMQVERFISSILYDDRLLELDFGDWEGRNWSELENLDSAKHWFADWVNNSTPNGESYTELANRVHDFFNEIKQLRKGKNVLIVTHGGVIRAFNAIINNIELKNAFNLNVDYGQVFRYTIT